MNWLLELVRSGSIAGSIILLGLVVSAGLAIGSLRIRSVGIGVAGVLFAGLLFGHLGFTLQHEVLEFARELGLILFVFAIGLQVGPGFSAAFRKDGVALNAMAAAIVLLGVALAVAGAKMAGLPIPAAVGVLAGATTNTPSLAAAQSVLADLGSGEDVPGLGYAAAYPFGVVGIILAMLIIRILFRVDVPSERQQIEQLKDDSVEPLERVNLRVENPILEGRVLGEIAVFEESGVVISRVRHGDEIHLATAQTVLHLGDTVLAVGTKPKLHALRLLVGSKTDEDLSSRPSSISTRRLIVTKKSMLGKTVRELGLRKRYEVQVTRVTRAGVDLPVVAELRLQYGDRVLCVGESANIDKVATILGDSARALSHPDLIPLFAGIVLGVVIGSIPISIPGIPAPVKLGLAGGPLLAAIVLSRVNRIGPLVWYLPDSASFILREFGIVLFLACVGLKSGGRFAETVFSSEGVAFLVLGACVTLVPLLVVGLFARIALKTNFLTVCGLLAGSMTDPPALAFASSVTSSDAPTMSYASVYPLTMILRVVSVQLVVLLTMA
ncbi:MAG: putative transporter [Candidatus Hydrogenedentota bacterium]